jgi:hypothetical protein
MQTTVLFPSESVLYPLQTSLGGHLFLVTQPVVALWIPLFPTSMPMWPIHFLPRHNEGDPQSHLLFCIAGQAHLPLQFLHMTVAQ